MFFALQHFLADPTLTFVTRSSLSQLDKLIMVVICRTRQFDAEKASVFGYTSVAGYLTGQTGNVSDLTWSGKDGDVDPEDVLNQIFSLDTGNITSKSKMNITKRFFLPFGVCSVVTGPPQGFKINNNMHKITLYLNGTGDYMVYVLDPEAAPSNQLPFYRMTGVTPSISLRASQTKRKYYGIQLTYHRNQANDGSCVNYPDQHGHGSFAECVDEENHKRTRPVLGCIVPWMSKQDQCSGLQTMTPSHQALVDWLISVYNYAKLGLLNKNSSCPDPCDMLTTHGKYLYTYSDKSKNKVRLTFADDVDVKTVVPAYGFEYLLVEVGSSLGLWLGLSVFGLFDVLVAGVSKLRILMLK